MATKTNIKKNSQQSDEEEATDSPGEELTALGTGHPTGHRVPHWALICYLRLRRLHFISKARRGGAGVPSVELPALLSLEVKLCNSHFENAIGRDFQNADALHNKMKSDIFDFHGPENTPPVALWMPTVSVGTLWGTLG